MSRDILKNITVLSLQKLDANTMVPHNTKGRESLLTLREPSGNILTNVGRKPALIFNSWEQGNVGHLNGHRDWTLEIRISFSIWLFFFFGLRKVA